MEVSLLEKLKQVPIPCNLYLVHNRNEWLHHPLIKFTEQEIDAADERGFISTRYGVDCWLARHIKSN